MVLNYIWVAFFVIAFAVALCKLLFLGDASAFPALQTAAFEMATKAFEISLGLAGMLTFWLGVMKVGERGGLINTLSRITSPFFLALFPGLPAKHPAMGAILMNVSANMLGLDNAASPLGLKAMQHMQEANPDKDRASNAMIMFMVINTAGLTILPVSVMALRMKAGAANPADIFIPALICTSISALAGIILVAVWQRINLFKLALLLPLGALAALILLLVFYLKTLTEAEISTVSTLISSITIFSIITLFIGNAFIRKVNVYDAFIEGAREGFDTAVKIIPYLVAILVGIAVFRACGALDYMVTGIADTAAFFGWDTAFAPALPTGLVKPFSGNGARGLMVEAMEKYGADSFVGRMVCTIQGGTETTFYTLALYYGSVNIRNTRYTAGIGLLVDIIGIIAAILLSYLFFA